MLNVLNVLGCIALNVDLTPQEQETGLSITVDTSDTEEVETGTPDDTGEVPDTADTEETDTQDTYTC